MTAKNLPPLQVGQTYRATEFQGFAFSAHSLHKAVTGEDTAILRLRLSNETILEIPAQTEDLHYLLRTLIEAYGSVAIEHLKARGWI